MKTFEEQNKIEEELFDELPLIEHDHLDKENLEDGYKMTYNGETIIEVHHMNLSDMD